ERHVNDEGLNDNRPAPVVNPPIGPLQPQKQWTRNNSEEAEVDELTKIVMVGHSGDLNRLQHLQRLRPDKKPFCAWAAQAANARSQHLHLDRILWIGLLSVLRHIEKISQGNKCCVGRIVGHENGRKIGGCYSCPIERTGKGSAADDLFGWKAGNF